MRGSSRRKEENTDELLRFRGGFDAVVTSFFLDATEDATDVMVVIKNVLKRLVGLKEAASSMTNRAEEGAGSMWDRFSTILTLPYCLTRKN